MSNTNIDLSSSINYHTFTLQNASKVLNSIDSFLNSLEFNGLSSYVVAGNRDISKDTVEISYTSHNDKGNFVQFMGFMVNTESLKVCLGLNGNNDYYIPIFSLKEFLEITLLGENKDILTSENIKYLIEAFKLDYQNFDLKGFLSDIVSGRDVTYRSVILTYINENIDDINIDQNLYESLNNEILFELLANLSSSLVKGINALIEGIFGNIKPEKSIEDVIANSKIPLDKLNVDKYSKSFENQYLRAISENGVDPQFARELSSFAIGIKNKIKYLDNTQDTRKYLALVSCGAYISNKKLEDSDIQTQNLLDLLRGINQEEDLLFSYDILETLDNKSLITGFIKKLDIEREVSTIGFDKFTQSLKNYTQDVLYRLDRGELDTKLVNRSGYSTVTIKSLNSAGRVFQKITSRLQSKFK